MSSPNIQEVVKEKYGQAALRVVTGGGSSCCGAAPGSASCGDPITSNLYDESQKGQLPETAVLASLGCGNPTALAQLNPGETVLDLGSGGGIDVLLSATRVGPAGKAYGLDMTDEMLALANENKRKAGATNVEFLKGEIENIPLPDNSVDVIISNCVINLSANKDRVLGEAFRVLKPGGYLVLISPNRWFPVEGHNVTIGSKTICPAPLIPWLPEGLTHNWTAARNYWPRQLVRHVRDAGFAIKETSFIWPILETYPWLPKPALAIYHRNFQTWDHIPGLRRFGVSTLVVGVKPAN